MLNAPNISNVTYYRPVAKPRIWIETPRVTPILLKPGAGERSYSSETLV